MERRRASVFVDRLSSIRFVVLIMWSMLFELRVFDVRLAVRDDSLVLEPGMRYHWVISCHRRSGGAELDISRSWPTNR